VTVRNRGFEPWPAAGAGMVRLSVTFGGPSDAPHDGWASEIRLSLRTGCFCNPGAGEAAFDLSKDALRKIFHEESADTLPKLFKEEEGMSWDEFLANLGMQSGGAVRVSLGLVTNFADVYQLVQFARTFLDTFPRESNLPPRIHC
jgi:selenocysteine lyase/cysteine desulfurase